MASDTSGEQPLILTARMDTAAFRYFNALRRAHFPVERNYLPAHLTLFHQLPGAEEHRLRSLLGELAASTAPFALAVEGVISLGRGTAYRLEAGPLGTLRQQIALAFHNTLSAQDRQPYRRPHVTVQNKVSPATARELQERLRSQVAPARVVVEGLLLWRYRGGPWEALAAFPFAGVNV